MVGMCISSRIQWFVWRLPIGETREQRLLTKENPSRDPTINNLEIVAYIAHLHIFCPLVYPLQYIVTKAENNYIEGWAWKVAWDWPLK